jgi:tetratricopeptide (TPR) repeat protein
MLHKYEEALQDSMKAMELDPQYANSYAHYGAASIGKGELARAEEYCLKSMKLNPKYERSYYLLGVVYEKQSNFEKAVSLFEQFLSFDSDSDYYPVEEAKERLQFCKRMCNKDVQ